MLMQYSRFDPNKDFMANFIKEKTGYDVNYEMLPAENFDACRKKWVRWVRTTTERETGKHGIQHKGHGPRNAGSVAVSERMCPIEDFLDGLETRT